MSYYSDATIKTTYIDPRIYVENARATFELDASEAAYLPDMRLTFLGVTADGATTYNRLVGALSNIRNYTLYDGKQVLSQLNRAQFYRGFLNQNKSNSSNEKIGSYLDCSALGFTVNGVNRQVERTSETLVVNTAPSTTDSAWLDLREVFPILGSMTHLPTSMFKNLRIVIEFDNSNQTTNATASVLKTLRPVLAVNVMTNPKVVDTLNKKMSAVSWLEVEHDQFVIPQSANNGAAGDQLLPQNITVKLNGYNAKRMERLLITKEITNSALEATGGAVQGFGKFSSQAVFEQQFQLRINGRNIFPRARGITGNNEMLAHVAETYGDCTSYPGSNQYGQDISTIVSLGRPALGQLSYIGCYVGELIADLQIDYQRMGLQDAGNTAGKKATTDALTCHSYCEVRKILMPSANGLYTIAYEQ